MVAIFGKIAEMIMKQAVLKGELKNLPGEGKQLKLENRYPYESPEERLFNMMMKSSGLIPIEILLQKEIENIEQRLEECRLTSEKENLKQKLKDLKFKYNVQREARLNFFNN